MFKKYLNDINVFISFYFEYVILLNFYLTNNKIYIQIYNLDLNVQNKKIDIIKFENDIKNEFFFIKNISISNDYIILHEKTISDIRKDKLDEINNYDID